MMKHLMIPAVAVAIAVIRVATFIWDLICISYLALVIHLFLRQRRKEGLLLVALLLLASCNHVSFSPSIKLIDFSRATFVSEPISPGVNRLTPKDMESYGRVHAELLERPVGERAAPQHILNIGGETWVVYAHPL